MITELLRKWFGLVDAPCETCEILREQLHKSDAERKELLMRLLDKDKSEPVTETKEEFEPIKPQFTPWRVRQQILEAEDRKKAQLMKDRIKEMEKDLGVSS